MNINKLYEDGTNNFLLAHLSRENNRPDIALKETLKALNGKEANVYICPVEGDDLLSFQFTFLIIITYNLIKEEDDHYERTN